MSLTAVMRMSPAKAPAGEADNLWQKQERSQRLQRLQQNALSRKSLAAIVVDQKLFKKELRERPLEDIIQDMRNANIRIKLLDEQWRDDIRGQLHERGSGGSAGGRPGDRDGIGRAERIQPAEQREAAPIIWK